MATKRKVSRPSGGPSGDFAKELLSRAAPLLELYAREQSDREARRLKVFHDAFDMAKTTEQKVALAVAYLGK
jgi:hypothetical protein